MTEATTETLCCGDHPPGVAGEPLKLVCQLCRNSPTYWRGTSPTTDVERCPRCNDPIEDHIDPAESCAIWARGADGEVLTVD